jgi:capsular polysaccharide biosynthesis protein
MSDRPPSPRSLPMSPSHDGAAGDVELPRSLVTGTTDGGGETPHAVSFEKTPFVSLPYLMAAVRRRWRLCAATGLAAASVALVLSLAYLPSYSATTTLLLRHPNLANPTRAMANDTEFLETRSVARDVVRRLGLDVTPTELVADSAAFPLSDNVMQITVSAPSVDEAVRRADALAQAFLDFRKSEFERQWRVTADALTEREKELSGDLESVVNEISRLAPAAEGARDADVRGFGELLTRRADLSRELEEIRQRIDDGAIETQSIVGQSRIVDAASEDERSPLKALAFNVIAGTVGGLGLGVGLVMLQAAASDRVRWRGDVAAALGAPVAVSTGAFRGPLWVQRWRFRRHRARPNADLARIVRHLADTLSSVDSGRRGVTVVSVDSDAAAALSVASLAVGLLERGSDVLIEDVSAGSVLARLLGMKDREPRAVPIEEVQSTLWLTVDPSQSLEDGHLPSDLDSWRDADIVLTLATVDPAVGTGLLVHGRGPAVAVVTAGGSSPTALRSAAYTVRSAGLQLASTVLIGAHRHDETLGVPGAAAGS